MKFSLDLKFDVKNDRQLQLALGATLVLLIVIISMYVSNLAYAEAGIEYYLGASCVGLGLLFWGLRSFRFIVLVPAILIILASLAMSMLKFDWRKDYIERAERGEPFLFEEYITHYPTLEEYLKANFFGGENWVAFSRTCGEFAHKGLPVSSECKSMQAIKDNFGLEMQEIMEAHYAKMKKTAKLIAKGRMTNKTIYQKCVQNKNCAVVPLLPPTVDPDTIEEKSRDFLETRRAFWSLVEDESLNSVVCDQMKLCSLLVDMGALNIMNLKDK